MSGKELNSLRLIPKKSLRDVPTISIHTKIKTDMQDKMLKTADLMTRLKLKNTYAYSGPHLNAMQQNNFIGSDTDFSRKELIKAINNAKKKKDK